LSLETDGEPGPAPVLAPAEPMAQPSAIHNIFIGKDGLRAGWSLLIFIAVFAALAYCVHVIGLKLYPPAPKTANASTELSPSYGFIAELIPFLITVFVTWIMSKIERRPISVYGFGGGGKIKYFFSGMAWGIVFLSILILTLWKSGLLVIDGRLIFGSDVLRYGAIWLLAFFLVGLVEEYLTRGYVQYTLSRGLAGLYQWAFKTPHSVALGFWTSAVLLSVLFGLGHNKNPGESPIGMLSAGLAGMVFCFSLWRTGSLWFAVGLHTSWDWGQSFLYGVADSGLMAQHHLLATHPAGKSILSGGTTGPEGSVFIIAILVLMSLIILFTLPRADYRAQPRI
jgi:membrane protease YdiL (CAAX protease family)